MIRYLKEEHRYLHLYFTDNKNCDECLICRDRDTIIWSYDTDKPINDTLKSLLDLIVNNGDNDRIIYTEDLEVLQKELNFDLYMFKKFNELLKTKNKLDKIKREYMWARNVLQYHLKK